MCVRRAADLINRHLNAAQFWRMEEGEDLCALKFATLQAFLALTAGLQPFLPQLTRVILSDFDLPVLPLRDASLLEAQLTAITERTAFAVDPPRIRKACFVRRLEKEEEPL